jgi:hypothetical protein
MYFLRTPREPVVRERSSRALPALPRAPARTARIPARNARIPMRDRSHTRARALPERIPDPARRPGPRTRFIMCNTHYTSPWREPPPPPPPPPLADLDKSEIAAAEVGPRVPHPRRSVSEGRARRAKSRRRRAYLFGVSHNSSRGRRGAIGWRPERTRQRSQEEARAGPRAGPLLALFSFAPLSLSLSLSFSLSR